jgi:hypothetical protein
MNNGKLQFTYVSTSDWDYPDIKSLILEVSTSNNEVIASFYRLDTNWVIDLSTKETDIIIEWDSFIEIITKFSLFMYNENKDILIKRNSDSKPSS